MLYLKPTKVALVSSLSNTSRRFVSTYSHSKFSAATTRKMSSSSQSHQQPSRSLHKDYPWTKPPLVIAAPMRVFTGPALAAAVASAGGLGFIGPGIKPESTSEDLKQFGQDRAAQKDKNGGLPVGVGFQLWNGDLDQAAEAVRTYKPCACWLFAPKNGQADVDLWTRRLREASPSIKIWLQVGTVSEAIAAAESTGGGRPDVLVVQGSESGGHGRTSDGASWTTLLPEISDALDAKVHGKHPADAERNIALVAAGGIADGRGIASALAVGADGVAMGTRFLASSEARISKGYQDAVVQASEGGKNTVRTHLYNHLRGTFGWPEDQWAPRTIVNKSWEDHRAGVAFEELKLKHDGALKKGDAAWGKDEGRTATYAGEGVGLVREVKSAKDIVQEERNKARAILSGFTNEYRD